MAAKSAQFNTRICACLCWQNFELDGAVGIADPIRIARAMNRRKDRLQKGEARDHGFRSKCAFADSAFNSIVDKLNVIPDPD